MNTPSNAGEEHNPDSLTPEQYGAPEWRLLTKGETIKQGDEYWCADWFDSVTTGVATTYMTAFTYRRRTTPPTQSQEGEPFDGQPEKQATYWRERYEIEHSELLIARRENDRLRSEVAGLMADAEKYRRRGTLIGRILHRAYETKSYKDKGHVCDNRQTVESIVQMIEAHLDDMRARAATEEGKRG